MGTYRYICKGCGKVIEGDCISGGDECVLIHIRHGKELGRVVGHYNDYGGVIEDKEFCEENHTINSHSEIYKSSRGLEDSYSILQEKKIYKGRGIDFYFYCMRRISEDIVKVGFDITKLEIYPCLLDNIEKCRLLKVIELYKNIAEKTEEKEKIYLQMRIDSEVRILLEDIIYKMRQKNIYYKEEFDKLPDVKSDVYSGVVAYHLKCYKNTAIPSDVEM